jgi:Fe-S-cluster containining protein
VGSAEDDASALCTRCALCCDGTLYGSVVLEPAEAPQLERVGLRVLAADAPTLPLRCAALSGALCSIYADRPSACARYACELRRDVLAASRGLDEALATVARVRALVDTLRSDLGLDPERSIWEGILALEAPSSAEEELAWARRHARALAAVTDLVTLVRSAIDPRFAGGGPR